MTACPLMEIAHTTNAERADSTPLVRRRYVPITGPLPEGVRIICSHCHHDWISLVHDAC